MRIRPEDAEAADPLGQEDAAGAAVEPLWEDEFPEGDDARFEQEESSGETMRMDARDLAELAAEAEDAEDAEEQLPEEAPEPAADVSEAEALAGETVAYEPTQAGVPDEDLRLIDVGDDDTWNIDAAGAEGFVSRVGVHTTTAHQGSQGPSMRVVALLAAAAMIVALLAVHRLLMPSNAGDAAQDVPRVTRQAVSSKEASLVISSLDGWWKTGRSLDGRYWHLEDGLMEVYAADGKIASQVLLDPASIEYQQTGPGGIEGSGYYLRDIAFFLTDDDPDTLYALDVDGSADPAANLLRSELPDFMGGGANAGENAVEEPEVLEGDAGEYVLPESNTRIYDASELEPLSNHDLFLARNEIYARHGYVFEAGELSEYFASKSWYHSSDVFSEGALSEVERANVSAILAIEQARGSQYV